VEVHEFVLKRDPIRFELAEAWVVLVLFLSVVGNVR